MFKKKRWAIVSALMAMSIFFAFLSVGVGHGSKSVPEKKRPRVIPPESPKIAALRKAVDANIDAFSERMWEMIDWMYHNPESGFEEFKASEMLAKELEKHGFEVEMGIPGLPEDWDKQKILGGLSPDYAGPPGAPTAFKAKYKGKEEHPVVGFMLEYDALRGETPWQGCQHNMQGPTGVGAAIALAKVMDKNEIQGSVWVIGAPAEEVNPVVKVEMAKTGYLDGIDFIARSHGTPMETQRSPGGFTPRHILDLVYTFHGKSSHAQSPWHGISALDAVMLLFHGIDMLREHSEPQFRIHGIVTEGGVAPNIVPERAAANFWIRHLIDKTPVGDMTPRQAKKKIDAKVIQIDNIAKGSALATGTKVDIDHFGECAPGVSVRAMNDIAFQYAVDYGGINIGERSMPKAWEEGGYASLLIPGISPDIAVEGIAATAGHTQENADITITPEGHRSAVLTAKVMAATHLRLLLDPALRKKVKEEHAMWVKKYNEE